MITTTYTYITFWSKDDTKKAAINRLEKQLSEFTETQTDVNFEDFLTRFLEKKPLLDAIGIEKIAIFHTLLYDNQCNTEFSPKVVDLIQKIGATFCISTDRIGSDDLGLQSETPEERFDHIKQSSDAKVILHRLLYTILMDIRYQSYTKEDEKRIWTLSHWLHNVPLQLQNATTKDDYLRVLQDVFSRAQGNPMLFHLLKANFPGTLHYEYELWERDENGQKITTLIPCKNNRADYTLRPSDNLVLRFHAVTLNAAQEIEHDYSTKKTSNCLAADAK
jgi:hypothetical protein